MCVRVWRCGVGTWPRSTELLAEAAAAGDPGSVPSLRTLQRAVRRDLSAGERAGFKGGEAARRRFDVYGKRPPTHRNACWEGHHKHIPVGVALDGTAVRPWVTWFIDVASKVIVGVAVTPHQPARDAILAALRTGISRTAPDGPFGGLPGLVRVSLGKDFLSSAVEKALGGFAVPVHDLPACKPYRKGTVEALNGAVEQMLLVSVPGYTRRARPAQAPADSGGGPAVLPGLRQGPPGLGGLVEHRAPPGGVPHPLTHTGMCGVPGVVGGSGRR